MYENLQAAWAVMCIDVIPFPVAENYFQNTVVPGLLDASFTEQNLLGADEEVAAFRSDQDISNIESKLWEYTVAGDAFEDLSDNLNAIFNEMFDMTGNVEEVAA